MASVNPFLQVEDLTFAVGDKVDAKITLIDAKNHKFNLSIKAKEIADEKQALSEYGSTDSGASLGDILGAALIKKNGKLAEKEAEEEAPKKEKKTTAKSKKAESKSEDKAKDKAEDKAEEAPPEAEEAESKD